MKQQLRYFLLLLAMILSVGSSAHTSTLIFTQKCNGSGVADDGTTWTVESDAAESTYDSARGIHYGTGSKAVSFLTLTSNGITGNITKITVNASGAKQTDAKLDVTVGGMAFGNTRNLTATATNYDFEGEASGEIIVKLSQSSAKKALYVKSIKVTFSTRPPIPTVTSIAELKQQASGAEVTLQISDERMARVTYVFGEDDTQEAFVRDNSGAVCFYGIKPNVPFKHGQHLAGQITGRYEMDNGLPKFCAVEGLTNTAFLLIADPITEPTVTPAVVTEQEYADHVADWVRLKTVEYTGYKEELAGSVQVNSNYLDVVRPLLSRLDRGAWVDVTGVAVPNGTQNELYATDGNGQHAVVFVLDETRPYVDRQSDLTDVPVRLYRTLTPDYWNTFCVPFDLDLPEGATATEFSGRMQDDGVTMLFTPATSIKAGNPYLIKAEMQNPLFENVTVKAVAARRVATDDNWYAFKGTYGYYLMKTDKTERFLGEGDRLYWPENDGTPDHARMPGMRAYFIVPADAQGAKVAFADETTGIVGTLVPQDDASVRIYNLAGQRVSGRLSDLPKGIYIVNGHKIVKK